MRGTKRRSQDAATPSQARLRCQRRKERERARHREEALHAAEELLARKRLHEITVQEIAGQAGFSVGYLYRLFHNRDALLSELVRSKHETVHELLDEELAVPEGDIHGQLSRALERLFAWMRANAGYARQTLRDIAVFVQSQPKLEEDLRRHEEGTRARITALFAEAIRLGQLEAPDAERIARTFNALLFGFIHEGFQRTEAEKEWTGYAPLIAGVVTRAFAPREGGAGEA